MRIALALVLICALVGGSLAVSAQSGYSVSVSGSTTDIPTITVSLGSGSHAISQVAVRDPGGSVTVIADGPEDGTYDVNLYNSDGDIIQSSRKAGGRTTTDFDLGCCSPGTYGVAIYDGEVKDLAGVVVSGYDVSLSMPDSAEQNSTVTATVELTESGGGSIEEVQIVLSGNGEELRTTAEKQSGSTYEATISLDGVSTGSYDAQGVVFSPNEFANGQNEVIGLGAAQSFTVTESSDGSNDDSDSSDDTDDPTTPTSTPTDTGEPTATPSTPTDADETATPTPTDDEDDSNGTPSDDPSNGATVTDDDSASGPTEVTETETTTDGAGFGALVAVVALVASLVAIRRD